MNYWILFLARRILYSVRHDFGDSMILYGLQNIDEPKQNELFM
jgi:hypothetical protein